MNRVISSNMLMADRVIRIILAVIIAGLIFYVPMNTALIVILALIALVLLMTGLTGYCYGYTLCNKIFKKK